MRPLSIWGWGYEDRFPNDEGRRAIAQQVSAVLGIEGLTLRAPPALEALRMPEPRLLPSPAIADFTTDAVPDVTNTQVMALTSAPALGPEEVEQFITIPVENAHYARQHVPNAKFVELEGTDHLPLTHDADAQTLNTTKLLFCGQFAFLARREENAT